MILNFKSVDQNMVFYVGNFTIKNTDITYIEVDQLALDQLEELLSGLEMNMIQVVPVLNLTTAKNYISSRISFQKIGASSLICDTVVSGDKGEKGDTGNDGLQGEPGLGIPEGGVAGDILIKKSAIDFQTEFRSLKSLFPLSDRIKIKLEFNDKAQITRSSIVTSTINTIDESDIVLVGLNSIAINHGLQEFPKFITFFSKWTDGNYHMKTPIFTSAAFSAHSSSDMNVLTISGITSSNAGIISNGDCFIDVIF
jgi:hypothetical protein